MAASRLSLEVSAVLEGYYGMGAASFTQETLQTLRSATRRAFTFGTSSNQANLVYIGTGSVTSSGTSIDLAGSLTDQFGNTLTFAEVNALLIFNNNLTAGENLLVGGAASNAVSTLFSNTNDVLVIGASGFLSLVNPLDPGYAITAGTADILKLASGGAGYNITYELAVIGRSA